MHRGRVAYEPNSLGGGCPFQAGTAGFVSFPQPVEEDKLRGKPEKFAEHYNQAALFFNSQTDWEKRHIIGAFRFELSKVTVPAIRERMVSSLANVDRGLADAVASGLGITVPEPMPRAIKRPPKPEVAASPALSLAARPGETGIRTRKVAILIAGGVEGAALRALAQALTGEGAVVSFLAPRLGTIDSADSEPIEATGTLENSAPVLFDALVLPPGKPAVDALGIVGNTAEFVTNQYRHGKTILALGASESLLEAVGVSPKLIDGRDDPGVLLANGHDVDSVALRFIAAIARHRHPERESDPPQV